MWRNRESCFGHYTLFFLLLCGLLLFYTAGGKAETTSRDESFLFQEFCTHLEEYLKMLAKNGRVYEYKNSEPETEDSNRHQIVFENDKVYEAIIDGNRAFYSSYAEDGLLTVNTTSARNKRIYVEGVMSCLKPPKDKIRAVPKTSLYRSISLLRAFF